MTVMTTFILEMDGLYHGFIIILWWLSVTLQFQAIQGPCRLPPHH
jgi:hypothetical protein